MRGCLNRFSLAPSLNKLGDDLQDHHQGDQVARQSGLFFFLVEEEKGSVRGKHNRMSDDDEVQRLNTDHSVEEVVKFLEQTTERGVVCVCLLLW